MVGVLGHRCDLITPNRCLVACARCHVQVVKSLQCGGFLSVKLDCEATQALADFDGGQRTLWLMMDWSAGY